MTRADENGGVPIIRVNNAGVYYWLKQGVFRREKFWALRNVSLDLHVGESLGVIGRNGVGKSTLLRLLSGVFLPDEGTIHRENVQASLLTLQLGFVPYLTGRENMIMGGLFLGMKRKDITAKMDKIIAFAELEEFIDQKLETYSNGMRARLGFSVAFEADPDILLIDEVLGVGDIEFRAKSSALLQKRIKGDKTVVLVSHQIKLIRELCTRALWIENGQTQMYGDVGPVLEAYQKMMRERQQAGALAATQS